MPEDTDKRRSPDTFYAIPVQLSASDSAQTPPSPISFTKSRPSRSTTHSQSTAHPKSTPSTHRSHSSRHSSNNTHSYSHRSSSHGPSSQFRRERERQLANTPRDTLIQLAISREHESREAKHLLTTALMQLEATRERLATEQESRITLEEERNEQGVKTTKAIIDAQKDTMDAKEEVRRFRLQSDNAQSELEQVGALVQQLQMEKTDIERALVRARTTARSFKERAVLVQAQEEGRREGFEEGLRQGRAMHGIVDMSHMPQIQPLNITAPGAESIQKRDPKWPSVAGPSTSNRSVSDGLKHRSLSLEAEIEHENLLKIEVNENFRVKTQLKQLEIELDRERQKNKEAELERKRLLEETERLKKKLREKDAEVKVMKERDESQRRKLNRELHDREEGLRKRLNEVEEENENEVRRLKAEIAKLGREKQAEKRIREEMEKREQDKDKESSNPSAPDTLAMPSVEQSIKYIPMPPPPIPFNKAGPVPRPGSSGSGSQYNGGRRASVGSNASTVSLETPGVSVGKRLSKIPEADDADSSPSPPPVPMNPPGVGYYNTLTHWPDGAQGPLDPDRLHPGISIYGPPATGLSNESQSSIQIQIEPPSRPPSTIDQQEVDGSGNFLSPNAQPILLPSQQETILPVRPRVGADNNDNLSYNQDTSRMDAQPNSPVIPGVTVPMPQPPPLVSGRPASTSSVFEGPLPPGFVPQTITNARGVTAPILQAGGAALPPVIPSALGSRAGQHQPRSAALSRSTPFYGNPLNQDPDTEGKDDPPMTSAYGPPSIPTNRMGGAIGPRSGSAMTPSMTTHDFPVSGPPPFGNFAPRPTYGPSTIPPTSIWPYPPGSLPPSLTPEDDEDEQNDLDPQTAHNTMINASIGRSDTPIGYDDGIGGVSPGYGGRW